MSKIKTLEEAKGKWEEIPWGRTKSVKSNDKFFRLTILYRTKATRTGDVQVVCQCECGNYVSVLANDIKRGHTKSCGCFNEDKNKKLFSVNYEYLEPVGDFGILFLSDKESKNKKRYAYFLCGQCKQSFCARINDVKSNRTKSCGCQKESFGIRRITQILENQNIPFIKEYKFEDCKDERILPFDFLITFNNTKIVLEFDGKQHYEPVESWGGDQGLLKTQEHDKIKNEYCIKNNIKLYRIPYFDELTLNSIQDILNEKYLIEED